MTYFTFKATQFKLDNDAKQTLEKGDIVCKIFLKLKFKIGMKVIQYVLVMEKLQFLNLILVNCYQNAMSLVKLEKRILKS